MASIAQTKFPARWTTQSNSPSCSPSSSAATEPARNDRWRIPKSDVASKQATQNGPTNVQSCGTVEHTPKHTDIWKTSDIVVGSVSLAVCHESQHETQTTSWFASQTHHSKRVNSKSGDRAEKRGNVGRSEQGVSLPCPGCHSQILVRIVNPNLAVHNFPKTTHPLDTHKPITSINITHSLPSLSIATQFFPTLASLFFALLISPFFKTPSSPVKWSPFKTASFCASCSQF
ncbi:hypothetical protein BLNAU_4929 [Blattamonas nauphoetae]|uniref:Uncharacterized protein n=1 Tax=Blattamonas nauphoetae TaxID=2049346 RepID=A0ABQ9Y8H3_9EUKA|nr:hypothetical protein BLNAU_4929 [Blattamonas nauphoetae]